MRWLSRFIDLIQDWYSQVRHEGWRTALPLVFREFLSLPYRRMKLVVVARSLLDPLPTTQPKISLQIREFSSTDLRAVWEINRPSEAKLCTRRLANGHTGLVSIYQGQLVGYAWATGKVDPDIERVPLPLNSGDVFCVDVYTFPPFRNQGVQTALTLARFRLFRDLGYSRAVAYISDDNYPSLAVWRKVGSEVIGSIDFIRIGIWRWIRYY